MASDVTFDELSALNAEILPERAVLSSLPVVGSGNLLPIQLPGGLIKA